MTPLSDNYGVAHDFDDVEVVTYWNHSLETLCEPRFHHLFSVLSGKGAIVGDAAA
jgi:hypothetical protein